MSDAEAFDRLSDLVLNKLMDGSANGRELRNAFAGLFWELIHRDCGPEAGCRQPRRVTDFRQPAGCDA